jgi:hypothetical protein
LWASSGHDGKADRQFSRRSETRWPPWRPFCSKISGLPKRIYFSFQVILSTFWKKVFFLSKNKTTDNFRHFSFFSPQFFFLQKCSLALDPQTKWCGYVIWHFVQAWEARNRDFSTFLASNFFSEPASKKVFIVTFVELIIAVLLIANINL